ncbi:hypothetical protein D3C72_2311660 [compost metagenome]
MALFALTDHHGGDIFGAATQFRKAVRQRLIAIAFVGNTDHVSLKPRRRFSAA